MNLFSLLNSPASLEKFQSPWFRGSFQCHCIFIGLLNNSAAGRYGTAAKDGSSSFCSSFQKRLCRVVFFDMLRVLSRSRFVYQQHPLKVYCWRSSLTLFCISSAFLLRTPYRLKAHHPRWNPSASLHDLSPLHVLRAQFHPKQSQHHGKRKEIRWNQKQMAMRKKNTEPKRNDSNMPPRDQKTIIQKHWKHIENSLQ